MDFRLLQLIVPLWRRPWECGDMLSISPHSSCLWNRPSSGWRQLSRFLMPSGKMTFISPTRIQALSSVHVERFVPAQGDVLDLLRAPQVFTRIFTLVSSWLHTRRILLLRYFDDWLVITGSLLHFIQHRDLFLQFCQVLRFVICWENDRA